MNSITRRGHGSECRRERRGADHAGWRTRRGCHQRRLTAKGRLTQTSLKTPWTPGAPDYEVDTTLGSPEALRSSRKGTRRIECTLISARKGALKFAEEQETADPHPRRRLAGLSPSSTQKMKKKQRNGRGPQTEGAIRPFSPWLPSPSEERKEGREGGRKEGRKNERNTERQW